MQFLFKWLKPSIMKLTKVERQEAEKFIKEHSSCKNNTFEGKFSYIITPTGIGDCVAIKCNACKEVREITDVESW